MSDKNRTKTTLKWLEKHPALIERLARLQEISTNTGGDLDTLAKAEREVIEEVDRLGAEALKQWLGSRQETVSAEEQLIAGSRRHSKKNSA
jgi:hypothetical protein